jgi:hypothetical protein
MATCTKAYKYSKLRQTCAFVELQYNVRWNGTVEDLNGVKPKWIVVGWSVNERKWSVDKCSEVEWRGVKFLVTVFLPLLECIYRAY